MTALDETEHSVLLYVNIGVLRTPALSKYFNVSWLFDVFQGVTFSRSGEYLTLRLRQMAFKSMLRQVGVHLSVQLSYIYCVEIEFNSHLFI